MAVTLAIALKSLFAVLGCLASAVVIYTVVTDGLPFRLELLTPWMAATLIDFYINIFAIGSWVAYKESNWITALLWAVLLFCLGSITTCGYIILQFLNLSTQESIQDPIYFVLLRRQKKNETEQRRKCSLLTARILSLVLGCLMLGTLIYTIVTDGSPFRRDVFTPWLSATLVDFYVNIVALSVWVAYKESSWLSAAFWIILLICFGSISTCAYIALQLFSLSSQDPVYLILFSSRNRAENGYEGIN
ncbi:uncharacterized protein LOC107787248 isoform X1 [Nicotiana tabacum]|uniref:Uncharacterized protein LOC107787248 isoform X1 n=1 Tax=Nicotiana tabacum TaxID=4097 RepID=A0A1S3ZIU9_TOBAC|nr:PREDICTED: uncharacterized protein LOC107787248 isoform X1 [Nicotiana tabacum]XP_033508025.1 uncharacterized protein LOC104118591 isoform X6 [Nicotiana tomentosiformis]